jgi:hypothetical protein
MSHRGIAVTLVVALAAAALVVPLALLGGDSRDAFAVNGRTVSQSDFDDELGLIADNATLRRAYESQGATFSSGLGAVGAQVSTDWLMQRLVGLALAEQVEARGLEVTEDDRASARQALAQGGQLPSRVADELVDANAAAAALVRAVDSEEALNAALVRTLRRGDVAIDPRYGSWDPRQVRVCPPSGCTG